MNTLIQFFSRSNKLIAAVTLACTLVLSACVHTVPSQPDKTSIFAIPDYEKYVLANGLTFYLMPQKEVPLITVNAVVRVGSVNDTAAGVAGMTVKSLLLGANGKSKTEIELMVDSLGASIYTDAGKEGSYLGADFMVKDSDVMLPLVQSLLLSPSFDEVEFAKLRQREIAGLAQAKESPRSVISHYFDKLIFGQHPYGNSSSGNRLSLAEINVSQLKNFYDRYYQPSNTAITLVGDFDVAQMKSRLDKLLVSGTMPIRLLKSSLSRRNQHCLQVMCC